MKGTTPPFLKEGDRIGLCATARFATPEIVELAKGQIEAAGFEVYVHPGALKTQHQLAGSVEDRVGHVNELLHDPTIKALWNVRGGYGSAEIVDSIDWDQFRRHPKWLIGFSDFTTFLCHAATLGIQTLHAPMPVSFAKTEPSHLKATFAALKGEPFESPLPDGIDGPVIGGNLSVIYSIYGTPSLPSLEGYYLFLEDLDEYHYHIDRMLLALSRKGAFDELKGVLLGTFSDIHDHEISWGSSIPNTLVKWFNAKNIRVWSGIAVGHTELNKPLILG
ncbi:MAG: hypothetical protein RL754_1113 [Bacteroidota bacterium]|jgi:muramoyltetrapeptide carboxypeptidase